MVHYQDNIEARPEVLSGKPTIRGTRISVELILERLAEGATTDDLLQAYPVLKVQDILAVLAYAHATLVKEELIVF